MILVTGISLYTSRIIINILGLEDFGIYNVVAGVVGLLGILNGALISATQRFLTFELGKNDLKAFQETYSMLVIIFLALSFVILIISIITSHWIVFNILVIPSSKLSVSLWIYYFAIVSFVINLLTIPFISSIIAYEKMNFYAYLSLIEAILKVALIFLLNLSQTDKLFTYGLLMMIASFIIFSIYYVYSYKFLEGCKYRFFWSKSIFNKLLSYISWNLFGSITNVLNIQGQSIILNIFFGPTINAAKAIADKINTIVYSFSNNFYMAVRPQIVKRYASGEFDSMYSLVYRSSKYSFYLLFLIAFPLILTIKPVLTIWLGAKNVSEDTITFSQLILIFSLINVFEQPITVLMQASGNIKNYQLKIGLGSLLFLPICYSIFKLGAPPYFSMIILILIFFLLQIIRILIAEKETGLSVPKYYKLVVLPIIIPLTPISVISLFIYKYTHPSFILTITFLIVITIANLISIWLLGLSDDEKNKLRCYLNKIWENKISK